MDPEEEQQQPQLTNRTQKSEKIELPKATPRNDVADEVKSPSMKKSAANSPKKGDHQDQAQQNAPNDNQAAEATPKHQIPDPTPQIKQQAQPLPNPVAPPTQAQQQQQQQPPAFDSAGGILIERQPFDLNTYAASSGMLQFCEKLARQMITRAMGVSLVNQALANLDDYTTKKMTDQISNTLNYAYFTYDTSAQFKTKLITIEPIPMKGDINQLGNSVIDGNQLDETLNSQRLAKDDYSELNDDEYLLNSQRRQIQNMSYSFTVEQTPGNIKEGAPIVGGRGMHQNNFGMPQFDCGQIEVIDMDEEMEPEAPIRDGCVRYALKLKGNDTPTRRVRLAPKFEFPSKIVEIPKPQNVINDVQSVQPSPSIKGQSNRIKLGGGRASQNMSMMSLTSSKSKSINGSQKLKFNMNPMRQFELAKSMHLNDAGQAVKQSKLEKEDYSNIKVVDVTDQDEREIQAHRRRVVGEEKRIVEEMKRQQEIDMMYEIMQKNARKNEKTGPGGNSDNITFDYEGKIIQIVKPHEELFPETITNPKIKFKPAQVTANLMKEQLDKFYAQKIQKEAKSKKSNSIEQNSIQDTDTVITNAANAQGLKKSNKLVDLYQPIPKDLEKFAKAKPMGSNFNEIQPKPGIAIVENGKVKQNQINSKDPNRLSLEDYQTIKVDTSSLSQLAESRLNTLEQKSFSLPQLNSNKIQQNPVPILETKSFMQGPNSNLDYSIQDSSILSGLRSSKAGIGGTIKRAREEAVNDLIDMQQILNPSRFIKPKLKFDRQSSLQDLNMSSLTSDIQPLFRKVKQPSSTIASEIRNKGGHKSAASLFVDTVSSIEAMDRLDQFNKYLVKGNLDASSFQVSRSQASFIKSSGDEKQYLKSAKELQKKFEQQVFKQAHYVERLTGNNQSHLAKKLITTPRNVKLLQPLALIRRGKDVNLLSDKETKQVFL
ncbi:UNKNOWN [Stylonychia lemnae]|uniref:Uncharacterized protein n=1 Tax=Stylonychia lemnae TaxID=5949 RepID=A0A078ADW1_STYLE|nr:UNKNOWN [Stylonychia lemnae]|eukprot:CDW79098.1 UNKNOWN [Stylonychia lemnae]